MKRCCRIRELLLISLVTLLLCGCQELTSQFMLPIVSHFILPKQGVREAQFAVRVERDAGFRTQDAVELIADIYHPVTQERTPTILVRIPFSKTIKNSLGADAVGNFWASRGYTVVIQGTRGRYKSGGSFYPLRNEREDGLATLQWLSHQPWFDGRLGMWGGSAFGYTQWVLADQLQPGPNALIIQIASTDFHQMFHPGGAFSLESALFWGLRSRGPEDEDPSLDALQRGSDGFPLIEADERAAGPISFFKDWVRHEDRDAYWRTIDGEDRARTIKGPVLLMAGWYDPFLPTQLRDFETIRREADQLVAAKSRLIIGPWTHADPVRFPDGSTAGDYRPASLAPTIPWFDQHLLGRPQDASLMAPVRIYVMGENVWRDENEWPLARAQYTKFYLDSSGHANSDAGDGRLRLDPPTADEPADTYVYDPRAPVPSRGGAMLGPRAGITKQNDVESRSDVLIYSTAPLDRDVEVTGPISATLYVSTTAPSTDFSVKLVDVHPDGKAYNVSDGILRRAYKARADADEIVVDLWPTSMLFRRGHEIRIEVSSSNFPRYDRNPNTGRDIPTETSPIAATQTVYHGARTQSRIVLPLIPR
jgi:putative CocE/NonD family hydrolase